MPPRRAKPTPRTDSALPHGPIHPFDRLHHTDTGGLIPGPELCTGHPSDAHLTAYYAVAPSILNALVDLWLQSRPTFPIGLYTFLDIGAGKGRALMAAAQHPFRQAVGIELNPSLAAIARANLAAFAGHPGQLAPASILQGDALEVPLPPSPLLAFLFHPFEAPLLRRLLRRLQQHVALAPDGSPAALDILYVNAEHASVLDRSPAFGRLFFGSVPMSAEDHLADLAEIANQTEYGSTGDEICAIYRFHPRRPGDSPCTGSLPR